MFPHRANIIAREGESEIWCWSHFGWNRNWTPANTQQHSNDDGCLLLFCFLFRKSTWISLTRATVSRVSHMKYISDVFFFLRHWWLMTQRAKTVQREVSRVLSFRKKAENIFYRANVFFSSARRVEVGEPLPSNFFCLYNECDQKKLIFVLSTIIFYQKEAEKKLWIVAAIPFFFLAVFSLEKTESITMSGKKFSACAIQSQKNLSVFFFRKK